MIQEIGLVVGVYVLARLLSSLRPTIGRFVTYGAVAITSVVLIDLAIRIVHPSGIASFIAGEDTPRAAVPEEAAAAGTSAGTVTRAAGGSITTKLGYGFAVAKESSLQREWIVVHQPSLPVSIEGTPGVTTAYVSREYGGDYRYRAKFTLQTREAIQAVQVRFLTFDVWGEHVRVLSYEEVADVKANTKKDVTGEWALHSENDVEKHYASIGYIARVRLADGRVVEAPTDLVVEEARKFSEKFTAAELEPTVTPPTQGGTAQGGA